jgi:hypothetical protein
MLRQEEGRDDDANIVMEIDDITKFKVPLATLSVCPKTS